MIRPPLPPPIKGWRMMTWRSRMEDDFISQCLELWDKGKDTYEISKVTFQSEAACERATRIGRERRRQQENKDGCNISSG
jgi:hypothetical protein